MKRSKAVGRTEAHPWTCVLNSHWSLLSQLIETREEISFLLCSWLGGFLKSYLCFPALGGNLRPSSIPVLKTRQGVEAFFCSTSLNCLHRKLRLWQNTNMDTLNSHLVYMTQQRENTISLGKEEKKNNKHHRRIKIW